MRYFPAFSQALISGDFIYLRNLRYNDGLSDNPKGSVEYIRSHILPGLWMTLFVLNTGGKSSNGSSLFSVAK
jgi:hypothetical protein